MYPKVYGLRIRKHCKFLFLYFGTNKTCKIFEVLGLVLNLLFKSRNNTRDRGQSYSTSERREIVEYQMEVAFFFLFVCFFFCFLGIKKAFYMRLKA